MQQMYSMEMKCKFGVIADKYPTMVYNTLKYLELLAVGVVLYEYFVGSDVRERIFDVWVQPASSDCFSCFFFSASLTAVQ